MKSIKWLNIISLVTLGFIQFTQPAKAGLWDVLETVVESSSGGYGSQSQEQTSNQTSNSTKTTNGNSSHSRSSSHSQQNSSSKSFGIQWNKPAQNTQTYPTEPTYDSVNNEQIHPTTVIIVAPEKTLEERCRDRYPTGYVDYHRCINGL